jgi:ribosomal protein L12E/L44/L45/RPP1/RPP2
VMASASMDKDDRRTMMNTMMEQFFGGMGAEEKRQMCATMMAKMTEGVDMKEMMPKMMMGMMSGSSGGRNDARRVRPANAGNDAQGDDAPLHWNDAADDRTGQTGRGRRFDSLGDCRKRLRWHVG